MRVWTFGDGRAEGSADMVALLGGKGAGLAGMSRLGVPVPPGFTIPTDVCRAFFAGGGRLPDGLWPEIRRGLAHIEASMGRRFGAGEAPLLVSVRSGAEVSMPGMMDTILNVGLSAANREALAAMTGQRRFALDSHRRLLEMFAEIALGLDPGELLTIRDAVVETARCGSVANLSESLLEGLLVAYQRRIEALHGAPVPDDPQAQLEAALAGVFRSWNSRRAARYRRDVGIADDLGTAVTVQAMVFGNRGADSATGVAFTRDPNTGEPRVFGEYLPDAQGEDVVSGAYTPRPIAEVDADGTGPTLEATMPAAYADLVRIAQALEQSLGDVQDLEFTVECGRLWMLQTRPAQRSARAEVRTAVDLAREGVIDRDEALLRVTPERLTRLLHPSVDVHARRKVIARGLPASPGAVSGVAVLDPDEAVDRAAAGERVILVRPETSTEDMEAIRAAVGILTSRGGMTSHAALVARGLGRCCVTGCGDLTVDERRGLLKVRGQDTTIPAGAWLTLDGTTGEVILGEAATSPADPPEAFSTLMRWADERRRVSVRANADLAADAETAFAQGADGIGLCRTEHMFVEPDRLALVLDLVFAEAPAARRRAAEQLLPIQRRDFAGIFGAAGVRPVAIRLLDLALHEIVPDDRSELSEVADRLALPLNQLTSRARLLRARNPVLGHRGCRLGLTFPEVYEIQLRAIFEAWYEAEPRPELQVVVPMVIATEEMRRLRRRIVHMAELVAREREAAPPRFTVGAMVEAPRACLIADELAEVSDFFLFGTNDLTTATFLISRDDAGRYLPFYLENDVLPADPFVKLDQAGVAALIRLAVERGRARRPDLACGLSGAPAGDPDAIALCEELGIGYISSEPHRVPIARVAAAQAAVRRDRAR